MIVPELIADLVSSCCAIVPPLLAILDPIRSISRDRPIAGTGTVTNPGAIASAGTVPDCATRSLAGLRGRAFSATAEEFSSGASRRATSDCAGQVSRTRRGQSARSAGTGAGFHIQKILQLAR
jgi:hypothetical protein